jgi:parallel beta-helix repeat protein
MRIDAYKLLSILIFFIIALFPTLFEFDDSVSGQIPMMEYSNIDYDVDIETAGPSTSRGEIQTLYENLNWTSRTFWNISGEEVIEDNTTYLKDSIIIKAGGSLSIENSLIFINSSDSPIEIIIEKDGFLLINNSNFTLSNILADIGYKFHVFGDMVVNNSELNYLGYLASVCTVDSCSGEATENIYTTGMDIKSDDVIIQNSMIRFSPETSIFINSSNPIIQNNTFSYNIKAITAYKSELDLNNNVFINNYVVFEFERCNVSFINMHVDSTYPDSVKIGIAGYLCDFKIINSTLSNVTTFIYVEKCQVLIFDSIINNSLVGILISSDLEIESSSILNLKESFGFYNTTARIKNNIFKGSIKGLEIFLSNNLLIENNSFLNIVTWGIELRSSNDVRIINNYFDTNIVGIFSTGSEIDISGNIVENSTFAGIDCENSRGEIKDNVIKHNIGGIILTDFEGVIKNNTILRNEEGISCADLDNLTIKQNIIANNSEWGINLTNSEPQIIKNIFSNSIHAPNRYGRVIKITNFIVSVKDSYGKYLHSYRIIIKDQRGKQYIDDASLNPNPYYAQLPEYEISNSGEKVIHTTYEIICIWSSGDQEISENKIIDISKTDETEIRISLPDLYITDSDITVSNTEPKYEEEITIDIELHYTGQVPVDNVSMKVTANNVKIEDYYLSFPASTETQTQSKTIKWKVSKYINEPIGIKVSIERNEIENQFLEYDKNNSASVLLDVKDEDDISLEVVDETGMWICTSLIIVVLLIILLIVYFFIQKRKASEIPPGYDDSEAAKDRQKPKDQEIKSNGQNKEQKGKPPKPPKPPKTPKPPNQLGQSKTKPKSKLNQTKQRTRTRPPQEQKDGLEKIRENIKNDQRSGPRINW